MVDAFHSFFIGFVGHFYDLFNAETCDVENTTFFLGFAFNFGSDKTDFKFFVGKMGSEHFFFVGHHYFRLFSGVLFFLAKFLNSFIEYKNKLFDPITSG